MDFGGCGGTTPVGMRDSYGYLILYYMSVSLICVGRRETIELQNDNNSYFTAGARAAYVGGYIIIMYTAKLRKRQVDRIAMLY